MSEQNRRSEQNQQKRWSWSNVALWATLVLVLAIACWSYRSGGLCYDLFGAELSATQRIDKLREFFQRCGPLAPLAYVLFVTIEVIIAPIPGAILYAPGGLLFGTLFGGTLAVIGNTIGAGVSCLLARSLGTKWIQRFFDETSVANAQDRIEKSGAWLIFFLRLNPLTSTDLLSYASGFSRVPVWRVMLATGAGMAPLCYAQSWLSESIFNRYPALIYPLLAASIIYMAIVLMILRSQFKRSPISSKD
jgi:uncharacterized membrane protein YdjX (TVP38/TMEM64 family)